jgi:general secretion pathway protein N
MNTFRADGASRRWSAAWQRVAPPTDIAPASGARTRRPGLAPFLGALLGGLLALCLFAPARWLAQPINQATSGRLMLAQTQGTVWKGSASVLLTGGAGSQDASVLPGRLHWSVGLKGLTLVVGLEQPCCLQGRAELWIQPGLSQTRVSLAAPQGLLGQWPNVWLSGLGTPWNTLQLGGQTRLLSQNLEWLRRDGRWSLSGSLQAEMMQVSSQVSPLPMLGSYRLSLLADTSGASLGLLQLQTLDGPLQLQANGRIGPRGLALQGHAQAATPADEAGLSNLLNIIGRRSGSRSILSIGTP